MPDFDITNHGSIVMIAPLTPAAQAWWDENVPTEGWQWMGGACAVEPRCVEALVEGLQEEGFTLQ